MKKTMTTTMVILAMASAVAMAAPIDTWFDLDNCAMCKNLSADQELFDNMQWENRLFANGLVEITTVPAKYEERFQKLMSTMEATGQKMMAVEQLPMCGMCMSYGKLMMAGATMDQMTAGENHLTVISSRDPKVIEMIRMHGQKTIDEHAKMMEAEAGADMGHEHPSH